MSESNYINLTPLEQWLSETNPQGWQDWQHSCPSGGIVLRVLKNQTRVYVEQCKLCGRQIKAHKKQDAASACVGDWSDELGRRWREAQSKEYDRRIARIQKETQEKRTQARNERNAYYSTNKWKEIRKQVLKRAKGVCEGCGIYYPSDIHHTTYNNFGNEFLFELVALCRSCHERVHGRSFGEEAA